MSSRSVEDRLREEYFDLLPDVRRATEHLEAEVRYHLLPISRDLDRFEQLVIRARVKECESALESLRRRQEGATFDPDNIHAYTLKNLKDLAAVRVLAFPRSRLNEIDSALHKVFPSWTPNPVVGEAGEHLASKYWGTCAGADKVFAEYQVVSVLVGLFWEIEHAAIYKPSPHLRGIVRSLSMQERSDDVLLALSAFETEFERLVREAGKP